MSHSGSYSWPDIDLFSLSAKQQKYIHEVRNKIYEVGKISESEKLVNQLLLSIGVDQINDHFR